MRLNEKERERGGGLTAFVLVLNTNNIPFAVPANTYLPEISNLATVIGDLT
jgi:hypothetical protein